MKEYRLRLLLKYGLGTKYDALVCESDSEWRALRRQGLGGSDMASVMGLSPWKTALALWVEKTGRDEPDDLSGSEAVYWGIANEAAIAKRFAELHPGLRVMRLNATLVDIERPFMHANIDRFVVEPDGSPAVLEIKTASEYKRGEWADGVPPYYLTQVVHYLAVTGYRRAYIAALIGGNRLVEHVVERDEEDVSALVERARDFWDNYVLADVMPQAVAGDSQALAEMYRDAEPGMLDAPDSAALDALVETYRAESKAAKDATQRKTDAAAEIERLIGGHRGIRSDTYTATWARGASERLDTARLQRERPDVYRAYLTQSVRNGGIRIKEV